MAKKDDETKSYTIDQLREIVGAGMAITEAKTLLDEGYAPADVLELAQLQSAQRLAQATETQTATAKAMQKAMRPENETHPGVSAFSYPEGDVAKPRVKTPYEILYGGFPVHKSWETHHWRECELFAQVEPGEYTVIRKDGSLMSVAVMAERDANQKITKLDIKFTASREDKGLIPAISAVLYQLVHAKDKTPKQAFLEGMQEYLQILGDAVGA